MKKIDFGSDELFIENYKKLKSSRKMAELYGCSKNTITKHATQIGYTNYYADNKGIKITNIPCEEVYEKYLELKSTKAVGEYYNCSGTAVRNYLNSKGYELKNYQAKLNNISPEEFIVQYEKIKNADKLGEIYNCSGTSILNYAKKIGYDVNECKEYKLSTKDKEEIIQAYWTESSVDLAKKYNVSRGMITKLWYDAGLNGKSIETEKTTEIDITGQKFGQWTVLYKTDKRSANGSIYWHCRCKCGNEKDVISASLRNGTSLSCGLHNVSKGNEKIRQLLEEAKIPFEAEKKFDNCKDKKELPFDFYVNNHYLIEFDGQQHFDPNSIFDYEYTHSHDLIKTEWCKTNNIPLIRIPYTHLEKITLNDLKLETSKFIENNNAD